MKTAFHVLVVLTLPSIIAFSQNADLQQRPLEEILREKNSYGAVLYNLARERFAAHEAQKETWILALNRDVGEKGLKKFTDGEFTVVSIPVHDHERDGARLYVAQFNSLNVRKADLLALDGKYAQALKIIRLVKRFDSCDLAQHIDLNSRIELLERLQQGRDAPAALEQLKAMSTNYGASAFDFIESKPPKVVTNLLEANLED